MTDDVRRLALARCIARRLQLVALADLRIVDKLLLAVEQLRNRQWERRLATGPGDRDDDFHVVTRITSGSACTGCNGRWAISDATESGTPSIIEMCAACLRAVAPHMGIAQTLIALATAVADEERENAELHDAARAEMFETGATPDQSPRQFDTSDVTTTRGRR